MTNNTLDQVQRLVAQLTPVDQVRLLAYVTSRVAQVFPATSTATNRPEPANTWERFFELGEELAATDTPECDTLTAAVLAMRRRPDAHRGGRVPTVPVEI
jgi:hypothetical protein